ncbi:MAG: hypothetical protein J7539_10130 [Niabella sp.]|nr:hypothetical protein [Niabella sp.]
MEFYRTIPALLVLILLGALFWIIKIIKLYCQKRTKIASINTLILGFLILIGLWELRIIPLSADWDFRNQTKDLTGKQFWCWNDYRYEEGGVRGEGFLFEVYRLSDEMAKYFSNPDREFFEHYPGEKFETTKWKETPILDTELVNYFTPIYGDWSRDLQREIEAYQKIVKRLAKDKGAYYAVRDNHGRDLYLISPKEKIIIYINHNM